MVQWEIQGKTVLITGGGSGLGALYAEAFLKEGAKNVAIVDINEEVGKATLARLNSVYPGKVIFLKGDVSKEEDIARTFEAVIAQFGQLDVLINNAGLMTDAPALVRTACDVNWQGVVSYTMKAQKHMRTDEGGKGGTIINISSVAGITKIGAIPAYCGSKAAVLNFSLSLANGTYFEETGVRIAVVTLGATDTALLQGLKARCYNDKMGDAVEAMQDKAPPNQKPESAVKAMIKIYKEASPGSVWLPQYDRPVKDITSVINNVYEQLTALLV